MTPTLWKKFWNQKLPGTPTNLVQLFCTVIHFFITCFFLLNFGHPTDGQRRLSYSQFVVLWDSKSRSPKKPPFFSCFKALNWLWIFKSFGIFGPQDLQFLTFNFDVCIRKLVFETFLKERIRVPWSQYLKFNMRFVGSVWKSQLKNQQI